MHGFTTRLGDLSVGSGDGSAPRSFELLSALPGVEGRQFATLNQVHGASVLVLEDGIDVISTRPCGGHDAVVTARRDVMVGVKTADCVPILLFDPGSGAVGAVHAGWRGTALKVAAAAVERMRSVYGTDPAVLRAAIGPCIGPCCYTVGDELVSAFEKSFGAGAFLSGPGSGHVRADLQGANHAVLRGAGVADANIGVVKMCTSCGEHLFFSHRRDRGDTGRQLAFIGRTAR
ncbi:MAG: peptidoglycan editing factor PgeF [Myxococcota bacterium]